MPYQPKKSPRLFLFLFIASGFLSYPFLYLNAQTSNVTTSVSIIDPRGVDIFLQAIPERRVPNVGGAVLNRSINATINVYHAGADRSNPSNILYTVTTLTDDQGHAINEVVFPNIPPGNYDITIKDWAHLTRAITQIYLNQFAVLDFTNNGANPLLAGDINLTFGDDKINAIDMALLVDHWGTNDDRSDLNQDTLVNSLDAAMILDHFNARGD